MYGSLKNLLPYMYKFLRHVNFEDVTNPAFSRWYFRGSPSILLSNSCKSKFANVILRMKILRMASWPWKPQKLHPSKICTYTVIRNGGSILFIYTFMEGVHPSCTISISHYYMPHSFTSFDVLSETFYLLHCWEVWYLGYANHPFYVSVIHILKFHCSKNSTIFGKCLDR